MQKYRQFSLFGRVSSMGNSIQTRIMSNMVIVTIRLLQGNCWFGLLRYAYGSLFGNQRNFSGRPIILLLSPFFMNMLLSDSFILFYANQVAQRSDCNVLYEANGLPVYTSKNLLMTVIKENYCALVVVILIVSLWRHSMHCRCKAYSPVRALFGPMLYSGSSRVILSTWLVRRRSCLLPI